MQMNAWARTKLWPALKLIKLDETSSFNEYFRQADMGKCGKLGTVVFIGDVPIALAMHYTQDKWGTDFQVCVLPEHRRKGLATRLLRYVALHNKKRHLVVYPFDSRASDFYIKNGVDPIYRYNYCVRVPASTVIETHRKQG
jgi:GNAT superfamily N-acetyltransferase